MAELSVIGLCTLVCVCLCTYVHRPPSSSVVPGTTHLSVPVIMAQLYFERSCHCFIIVQPCSRPAVPSKITGWSCGFPATISPCTRLCSPHITMETTRFLSPRGSIKHFYFEKLFMCQWKGWQRRRQQRFLSAIDSLPNLNLEASEGKCTCPWLK